MKVMCSFIHGKDGEEIQDLVFAWHIYTIYVLKLDHFTGLIYVPTKLKRKKKA